jgi:hypothetical protein
MKKFLYILFIPVAMIVAFSGCKKKFDDLSINENKPSTVPPSLLFNGVLNAMYDGPDGANEKWCQYFCENYDYYGNNRYDLGEYTNYYSTLKNVVKMEEEAVKGGSDPYLNPYRALGKFFKAYFFVKMTRAMGDIPMNQALLGVENLNPVYDPQKEVYKQAFVWLDSANTDIAQLIVNVNLNLAGDIYYGNDLSKWQKLVNTFRLRVLLDLSEKTASDPDLNVKEQFAAIVGDPAKYPLMESSEDNLQFVYTHPTNDYPSNPSSYGFNALRKNTSATYVGLLTQLKDPRVFVTTEPAQANVAGGTSPTSFDAFVGADPGEDLGQMYIEANGGQLSLIGRKRFFETYTGEPSIQIGFPEMCFNIAEAINRGWLASGPLGDAEAYYQAGIKASWAFYSIPETGDLAVAFLESGSPGNTDAVYNNYTVPVDFTTYYNQGTVKYSGNNPAGLTQILKQKYLALFRHAGLESFYTNRRTGVPTFTTGIGTGNSGRIPVRFQYFSSERTANETNYNAALQSQYAGNDDINSEMWLLK